MIAGGTRAGGACGHIKRTIPRVKLVRNPSGWEGVVRHRESSVTLDYSSNGGEENEAVDKMFEAEDPSRYDEE